jgi:hypothetical protein
MTKPSTPLSPSEKAVLKQAGFDLTPVPRRIRVVKVR